MHEKWDHVVRVEEAKYWCFVELQCNAESDLEP